MQSDAPTVPNHKKLRSLKDLIDSLPETQFMEQHGMYATVERYGQLTNYKLNPKDTLLSMTRLLGHVLAYDEE